MTPHYNPLHSLTPKRRASFPNLNYTEMRKVCSAKPSQLAKKYGLEEQKTPRGSAWFKDNGASVLAIAHLDSRQPFLHFDVARLKPDTLIYCPTLDDRLGAYVILDWLTAADIKVDILLTENEEKGQSTAGDFQFPEGKKYNWMFSFDRAGTDVVMYNYRDTLTATMLEKHGWKVGYGSYSCISELEDLGIKGFNFGVGYHEYHSEYAFASRNEIMANLRRFYNFFNEYANVEMPHEMRTSYFARDRRQGTLPFHVYNQEEEYDANDIITRAEKQIKGNGKKREKPAKIFPLNPSIGSEDKYRIEKAEHLTRAEKRVEKIPGITAEEIDRKMAVINTAKKRAIATLLCQDIGLAGFDEATKETLYNNSICLLAELTPMSRIQFLRLDGATKAQADNIEAELLKYSLGWNTNLNDYKITVTIIENTINNTIRKEIVNGFDNTMSQTIENRTGLEDKAEKEFALTIISLPRDKVILKPMKLPLLPAASKPTEKSQDVDRKETELIMISLGRDKANKYKLIALKGKLAWKENLKVGFQAQPVPSI